MRVIETYGKLAKVFGAFSHPLRLFMLEVLSEQECCVCHLTALLGRPQPYVSQQLAILREASLLSERSEGTYVFYRIADERVVHLVKLGCELVRRQRGFEDFSLPVIPECPLAECPCPHCRKV